jgi:hypothetical protein
MWRSALFIPSGVDGGRSVGPPRLTTARHSHQVLPCEGPTNSLACQLALVILAGAFLLPPSYSARYNAHGGTPLQCSSMRRPWHLIPKRTGATFVPLVGPHQRRARNPLATNIAKLPGLLRSSMGLASSLLDCAISDATPSSVPERSRHKPKTRDLCRKNPARCQAK